MTEIIESKFVVLRLPNGHAEPMGTIIQTYDTEQEAKDACTEKAKQYANQTFAWFGLVGTLTFQPVMIEKTVKKGKRE